MLAPPLKLLGGGPGPPGPPSSYAYANSVDLDEVAHFEPPHQDLRCLRIQLFSSLVLKC